MLLSINYVRRVAVFSWILLTVLRFLGVISMTALQVTCVLRSHSTFYYSSINFYVLQKPITASLLTRLLLPMTLFPFTGGYLSNRFLPSVTAQERESVIMEPNTGLIDSTPKIVKIGVRMGVVRLVAPVQPQDTSPLANLSE